MVFANGWKYVGRDRDILLLSTPWFNTFFLFFHTFRENDFAILRKSQNMNVTKQRLFRNDFLRKISLKLIIHYKLPSYEKVLQHVGISSLYQNCFELSKPKQFSTCRMNYLTHRTTKKKQSKNILLFLPCVCDLLNRIN